MDDMDEQNTKQRPDNPVGWNAIVRDARGLLVFSGVVTWDERKAIKAWREEMFDVKLEQLATLPDSEQPAP